MGIGKRIKEARLKRGLTQEELAKLVGVTKGAIANYETETSHPKEPVMYALFKALDVEPNFLFQDCIDSIKKDPANHSVDEARQRVLHELAKMSPEEFELVKAFIQGMRAKRQGE